MPSVALFQSKRLTRSFFAREITVQRRISVKAFNAIWKGMGKDAKAVCSLLSITDYSSSFLALRETCKRREEDGKIEEESYQPRST